MVTSLVITTLFTVAHASNKRTVCTATLNSKQEREIFFGLSELGLKIDLLENHSCKNTCDGVLKRPKEIFSFGCNTPPITFCTV